MLPGKVTWRGVPGALPRGEGGAEPESKAGIRRGGRFPEGLSTLDRPSVNLLSAPVRGRSGIRRADFLLEM